MWISKKTIERGESRTRGCAVGTVTIGGNRPCVLIEGETRNAELVSCGGGLYLPRVGDEVLVGRTVDGESLVLGKISNAAHNSWSEGEVYITSGNGSTICVKKTGEIEISGTVRLSGNTYINGNLFINGQAYDPEAKEVCDGA